MKLTPIHFTENCDNASCPTIYKNEAGNYIIQGFKVIPSVKNEQGVPINEDMVEVPREFLDAFLAKHS